MRAHSRIELLRAGSDLAARALVEPVHARHPERVTSSHRGDHASIRGERRERRKLFAILLERPLRRAHRGCERLGGGVRADVDVVEMTGIPQPRQEGEEDRLGGRFAPRRSPQGVRKRLPERGMGGPSETGLPPNANNQRLKRSGNVDSSANARVSDPVAMTAASLSTPSVSFSRMGRLAWGRLRTRTSSLWKNPRPAALSISPSVVRPFRRRSRQGSRLASVWWMARNSATCSIPPEPHRRRLPSGRSAALRALRPLCPTCLRDDRNARSPTTPSARLHPRTDPGR